MQYAREIKTINFVDVTQTFPVAFDLGAWKRNGSSTCFILCYVLSVKRAHLVIFWGKPWFYKECIWFAYLAEVMRTILAWHGTNKHTQRLAQRMSVKNYNFHSNVEFVMKSCPVVGQLEHKNSHDLVFNVRLIEQLCDCLNIFFSFLT